MILAAEADPPRLRHTPCLQRAIDTRTYRLYDLHYTCTSEKEGMIKAAMIDASAASYVLSHDFESANMWKRICKFRLRGGTSVWLF